MQKTLISILLFFTVRTYAQRKDTLVHLVNPSSVAPSKGYSQAAVVELGHARMIILSGQIAVDKDGQLVGKADMEAQTRQVFNNIRNIVASEGGSMNDVVKLSYFVTDVSQIQYVRKVRDEFVNKQKPPASTLVQVSRLFRDDLLLEVEATAIIPKH